MKQQLQTFPVITVRDFEREELSDLPMAAYRPQTARQDVTDRWSSGMRLVGILAFGQSLLFLALWLFLCASAGAATKDEQWENPELKISDYQPTKNRDPFFPKGVKLSSGDTAVVMDPSFLRLQGIVYEPVNPSAMVNDKLLYVRRPVTVSTDHGTVEIIATEITRERVIVKVGDREVELRLGVPPVEKVAKP